MWLFGCTSLSIDLPLHRISTGKSSLLRVIGGLWPFEAGSIARPLRVGRGGVFFVPQRPFVTFGSLRQQLLYPHVVSSREDEWGQPRGVCGSRCCRCRHAQATTIPGDSPAVDAGLEEGTWRTYLSAETDAVGAVTTPAAKRAVDQQLTVSRNWQHCKAPCFHCMCRGCQNLLQALDLGYLLEQGEGLDEEAQVNSIPSCLCAACFMYCHGGHASVGRSLEHG